MRTLVILGAVAALASSACSDQTGILVNTTNGDGFAGEVDSLRYFVGADVTDFSASNYFLDESEILPVKFDARSLHGEPYRLLIRPPDVSDSGARYAIGALAYLNGEKVGFGYLADPIGFTDGSVILWDLRIRPLGASDDAGVTEDCLRWQLEDGSPGGNIGSALDRDCDGHNDEISDCDPSNPEIFQEDGKAEICGNLIDDNCDGTIDGLMADGVTPVREVADGQDNDCDESCDTDNRMDVDLDPDGDGFTEWGRYGVCDDNMTSVYDCVPDYFFAHPSGWDYCDDTDSNCDGNFDEETPCFFTEDGVEQRCLQGLRQCNSGSLEGECVAVDSEEATLSFYRGCEARTACVSANDGNPMKCALKGIEDGTALAGKTAIKCATFHTDTGEVCSTKNGSIALTEIGGPDNVVCTYQIIGPSRQQGYELSLESLTNGTTGVVLNDCGVRLNVKTTPASGNAHVLVAVSKYNTTNTTPLPETLITIKLSSERELRGEVLSSCPAADEDGLICSEIPAG